MLAWSVETKHANARALSRELHIKDRNIKILPIRLEISLKQARESNLLCWWPWITHTEWNETALIGKSSSQTPFNQSIDIYHACRVSCYHCSAAVACRWNNDPCYNHLKKVVEWSINDLEISQEPCWSNLKLNQWISFEVVAQQNACWLGNFLNMPKPSKPILQLHWREF